MTASSDPSLPQIRAALDAIPSYVAGKPPPSRPGIATYKLSSNENPYPPLPGVLEAVAQATTRFNRYPDMGASALYAAIAKRFDVPESDLAAGTGSVAALYHLLQATCEAGDEVVYAWRSFEAYPIAVPLTGATSVRVPVTLDGRHDLPAMADAVTDRTRVVIVCSPNNPTGPAVHRDELLSFIERVPSRVLIVIDEAYREFIRDPDVIDPVEIYRDRDNVAILRTFSKAYGLAGLRIGFAIAPRRIADAIRKAALPFGISQIAQDAAVASLAAEEALFERVEALVVERARVDQALREQGWDLPESQANFVWMGLGEDTMEFAGACAEAGIMVRPFAGDGARVTIGEVEANDVFLRIAEAWRRR
ncbi:MAG TPA: histidinol-phosphate transaminase [Nocardioidaceae bacterium]|nr:histidinol-phosphate transaminase [Nocardioidaceae bacterium]